MQKRGKRHCVRRVVTERAIESKEADRRCATKSSTRSCADESSPRWRQRPVASPSPRQEFDEVKVVIEANLDEFFLAHAIDEMWCLERAA